MSSHAGLIDELEADLGLLARLRVIQNAGGQRRFVPRPENAASSKLVAEFGLEVTIWLSGRCGGETVTFPSIGGSERDRKASLLRAAVLDAGLTDPIRSANDIAAEFEVSERWVRGLRAELREEAGFDLPQDELPLFAKRGL